MTLYPTTITAIAPTAMLGPSGSGKTTLLTALGGRLGGHLTGNITYNSKPFSNAMRRNTGFVTQDDILYPHLTVTETLVYTALLRLLGTLTKSEKTQHAEAVISQLGLSRCRHNIIGGPLLRGVSGGERKRVSIGQEMLINPSLLFLDEPTSGLDSTTAQRIVSKLRELTNGGRTIVMTIHQPSRIEFSERLSYFGIATSLIIYLTKVLGEDLKTAAKSANYWTGVTTMMPLIGGFLADAYLGGFSTVLASSIVYLLGLLLLTMSRVVPGLKPCDANPCHEPRKIHEVFFFLAIYLILVGTGGHKPSLESFGADQFDDDHSDERKKKMSFFNWWNFGVCCGLMLGVTVIVYIQDHISWAAADIILTAVMALSIVVFWLGRPVYRFRKPTGSPLTPLAQVLVAAVVNRNLPYPSRIDQLYEVPKSNKSPGRHLIHTDKLKFLDKAAIVRDGLNALEKPGPWRLATVTKVEEMKLIVNMIPIWLTTVPFGICIVQASTFFIKQGATLDRKIHNFIIPSATIYALAAIGMTFSVTVYDKLLVPFLRRATGNERGISILQRIGIGMLFSIATMVVAALVERKRLNLVERNPVQGSASMSVFWLAPQFLIIGIGNGFALVGLQEYFYDQVPDSMRSLGIGLYLSVIGAANFISSLLITVVDRITERGGKSWIGKDLNSSRLDYFYWLLAGITAGNLCIYTFVAMQYSYKNVRLLFAHEQPTSKVVSHRLRKRTCSGNSSRMRN